MLRTGFRRAAQRSTCLATMNSSLAPKVMRISKFHSTQLTWKDVPKAFKENLPITYEELKPLTEQPTEDILLIDVREEDEVATGSIPSSVNLPLSSIPASLNLPESEFRRRYAFHKPAKDQLIIVNCRSGKRSQTALNELKHLGYNNVRNYEGSWLDWIEKTKKSNSDSDDF